MLISFTLFLVLQVSLGDSRSYYISTSHASHGVISANSVQGNKLNPVSWEEMEDSVTGEREKRKVAKPEKLGR